MRCTRDDEPLIGVCRCNYCRTSLGPGIIAEPAKFRVAPLPTSPSRTSRSSRGEPDVGWFRYRHVLTNVFNGGSDAARCVSILYSTIRITLCPHDPSQLLTSGRFL